MTQDLSLGQVLAMNQPQSLNGLLNRKQRRKLMKGNTKFAKVLKRV